MEEKKKEISEEQILKSQKLKIPDDSQNSEARILKFWKDEKIYEKSRKKNARGKKFYMMDGPPYANGNIHMGTALNKIMKDVAMRTQRMQGKDVFDRAGYDTHGVPIEFQVEKEIGSKSKKDIEQFGVKKFIDKCKEFATKYIGVMNSQFENLGVWMDFNNPYLTLNPEYIETIWDTFKEADKKNLLYLGKYPVHICPRCETAVAFNEIEYAKQEDTSVFVKFPLKNKKNTFLLIWTTTPWTLPANTGVMVHPDFDYQEIELSSGERWIVAKDLVPRITGQLGIGHTVKKEFRGESMEGWEYVNPLFKHLKLKTKNAYRVVLSGRYVNIEDGTGLVHCAPGHGREDYEVGKENKLDMPSPVEINGTMTEEAGKYAGKKARVVDAEIIQDLENDGVLVNTVKYIHDYPLCWRCKSPLLMLSQPQWFLKISEIQKKLLKDNEKTVWVPDWMKLRMNAWLEGVSDWPVSRKRYWGTPLPIWLCEKCEKKKVIGSIEELEKLSGKNVKEVHKPEIDEIEIECKCGGKMKRVPDVLDVWFDAGVSSWAALKKEEMKRYWPADLNLEGKDQIRGWWNSQMILSEIKFGKKPFESIVVHGMVLDLGKRKMSKSLGNIVSPQDAIEKYGRDYLRYYFAKVSKGEDFAFDESELENIRKVLVVLVNINNFVNQLKGESRIKVEDRWILSRYNSLVKNVVNSYNQFRFPDAVAELENFLVNDLSKTYIKIIRERSDETSEILNQIRKGTLKLCSPIIPFLTEKIWQELRKNKIVEEESVHLSVFPEVSEKSISPELEKEFGQVLKIIERGLAERDFAKIGLKWPLKSVNISAGFDLREEMKEIISRQLNVKEVYFDKIKELEGISVKIDTKITPELEIEGYAREVSRNIQAERKKAGLVKKDEIELVILTRENFVNRLDLQKKFIKERTNSKKISISPTVKTRLQYNAKFTIKGIDFEISFSKA
jgi:isoleucyl-tRNA synthetase